MSRPSSFFLRLFGLDQSSESSPVPSSIYCHLPKRQERSKYDCLAKGIARSWIEGAGWEIERSEAKTKEEGAFSWTGNTRPMWKRDCHDVSLTNRELDVVITLEEDAGYDYHSLGRLSVKVHGTSTICDYTHLHHSPDPDAQYLLKVIRDNPYPALKPIVEAYEAKQARLRREDEINKAAADKAIRAIEKLGCPS